MSEISIDPRKTVCPECTDKAEVVLDYSSGDLICTGCGLVLEGHCIDEGQEWRNFAPEGVDSGPHVGGRERGDTFFNQNDDINDFGSWGTTDIGGGGSAARGLQQAQRDANRMAKRNATTKVCCPSEKAKLERQMKKFTTKIREVVGRLSLGEAIVNRCVGMLQDLSTKGELKAHITLSTFCALVHQASCDEKATRTVRELAQANAVAAGKNEADFTRQIEKQLTWLRKVLGLTQTFAYVEDESLYTRYVNRLQLSQEICKPASYISQQAYRFGLISKEPHCAVIASSIFIVSWLWDIEQKPNFASVAVIAKVTEASTKNAYKAIHPYIQRLLPEGFRCRLPTGINGLPPPLR